MTSPQENSVASILCVCGDPVCDIPYGTCHCGCGGQTRLAPQTATREGWIRGKPQPRIKYHTAQRRPKVDQPKDVRYRHIALTSNQVAVVDAEDYEHLIQWFWQANWSSHTNTYYAARYAPKGSSIRVPMGREILNKHGVIIDGFMVDHRNGDTLDNRKCNLRVADKFDNARNIKTPKACKSGITGVRQRSDTRRWMAFITIDGRERSLGTFKLKFSAIRARILGERKYYGEFGPIYSRKRRRTFPVSAGVVAPPAD